MAKEVNSKKEESKTSFFNNATMIGSFNLDNLTENYDQDKKSIEFFNQNPEKFSEWLSFRNSQQNYEQFPNSEHWSYSELSSNQYYDYQRSYHENNNNNINYQEYNNYISNKPYNNDYYNDDYFNYKNYYDYYDYNDEHKIQSHTFRSQIRSLNHINFSKHTKKNSQIFKKVQYPYLMSLRDIPGYFKLVNINQDPNFNNSSYKWSFLQDSEYSQKFSLSSSGMNSELDPYYNNEDFPCLDIDPQIFNFSKEDTNLRFHPFVKRQAYGSMQSLNCRKKFEGYPNISREVYGFTSQRPETQSLANFMRLNMPKSSIRIKSEQNSSQANLNQFFYANLRQNCDITKIDVKSEDNDNSINYDDVVDYEEPLTKAEI